MLLYDYGEEDIYLLLGMAKHFDQYNSLAI